MYLGYIQEFLDKESNRDYSKMDTTELITNYLEIMRYAMSPFYTWQSRQMKSIIENIEEYITDDILNDLINLTDKDLIKKYDLRPETVSSKYVSINVNDIKDSAYNRIDINHAKEAVLKQYDEYVKRGWL